MPAAPEIAGVVGAVRYLAPVLRSWRAHRREEARLRRLLVEDQRLLDADLGALGRRAREERVELPSLADDLARVDRAEARHAAVHGDARRNRRRHSRRIAQHAADAEGRGAELTLAEEALATHDRAQREHAEALGVAQANVVKLDVEIRALDVRAGEARAAEVLAASLLEAAVHAAPIAQPTDTIAAAPGVSLPAVSDAPATAAESARAEAATSLEHARAEIARGAAVRATLIAQRAVEQTRVDELEAGAAERERVVDAARADVEAVRRTIAGLRDERARFEGEHDARQDLLVTAQDEAQSEITRALVNLGTLLNLQRVDHTGFRPLYAHIDELKARLVEREIEIRRVEKAARAFDHAAIQRGLIAVGALVAALIFVVLALVLLVAD